MKFVIVTGMSGSGKSNAIKYLEDMGYYCIDNMPPKLFTKFAQLCTQLEGGITKVAFAVDTRSGKMFKELCKCLDEFENKIGKYEILFLDCDDSVLLKRYKETRRSHPLSGTGIVSDGIKEERILLEDIKRRANYIVDTSNMKVNQLRDYINTVFATETDSKKRIAVNVMSFGFKYGVPTDADLVFDVRFLPNPFYIPELKEKTGLDSEVSGYVMSFEESKIFAKKLFDMFDFLMPQYIKEGKSNLVIAIGCTGGKHRSVTLTNELANYLTSFGYNTFVNHRDINKDRVLTVVL